MNVESHVRLIAGIVVLLTVTAGYWLSPWFFLLTALMGANLVQSGFTNWCPTMPVLRSLGVKDSAMTPAGRKRMDASAGALVDASRPRKRSGR